MRVHIGSDHAGFDLKWMFSRSLGVGGLVRYTRADYDMTMETLIEGAILAVIVVFLFLRDIRATIISALAIPLSVLPTFAVMEALASR